MMFYKNLSRGLSVNESFYQAQKKYLESANGSLAHPLYWASFRVISNNPNPLFEHPNPLFKIFKIAFWIGVLVVFLLFFRKKFKFFN